MSGGVRVIVGGGPTAKKGVDPDALNDKILRLEEENRQLKLVRNEKDKNSTNLKAQVSRLEKALNKVKGGKGGQEAIVETLEERIRELQDQNNLLNRKVYKKSASGVSTRNTRTKLTHGRSVTPRGHKTPRIHTPTLGNMPLRVGGGYGSHYVYSGSNTHRSHGSRPSTARSRSPPRSPAYQVEDSHDWSADLPSDPPASPGGIATTEETRQLRDLIATLRSKLGGAEQQINALMAEKENMTRYQPAGTSGEKSRQISELVSKISVLEAQLQQSQANYETIFNNNKASLEEIENLQRCLHEEQLKVGTMKVQRDADALVITDAERMQKEIDALRETNRLLEKQLVSSVFSGKNPAEESIKAKDERIQELENLLREAQSKAAHDWEKAGEVKHDLARETAAMEQEIRTVQLEKEMLEEKLKLLTGDSDIDIDADLLEKALDLIRKQRLTGDASDLEFLKDNSATESLKRENRSLREQCTELMQEMDKLSQMLMLQKKMNEALKEEASSATSQFERLKTEFDRSINDKALVIDARNARIRQLEEQVRDLVYAAEKQNLAEGAALTMPMGPAGPRPPKSRDRSHDDAIRYQLGGHHSHPGHGQQWDRMSEASDMSISSSESELMEGENIFEFVVETLSLFPTSFLAGPPATFVSFDFFEHETQVSPVVGGFNPSVNFSVQFVVKVDHFFLRYLSERKMTMELNQAQGTEFDCIAKGVIAFEELLADRSKNRFTAACQLHDRNNVPIGSVTYTMQMRFPITETVKMYKQKTVVEGKADETEDSATKGKEPSPTLPEDADPNAQKNVILVEIISGLGVLSSSGPSIRPYVHYQLLDFAPYDTSISTGNSPNWGDVQAFPVVVNEELERYLSTARLTLTLMDDSRPIEDDLLYAKGEVDLSPLANGKDVVDMVSCVDKFGGRAGSLRVSVRWKNPFGGVVHSSFAEDVRGSQKKSEKYPSQSRPETFSPAKTTDTRMEELQQTFPKADVSPRDDSSDPSEMIEGSKLEDEEELRSLSPPRHSDDEGDAVRDLQKMKKPSSRDVMADILGSQSDQTAAALEDGIQVAIHTFTPSDTLQGDDSIERIFIAYSFLDKEGEGKDVETPGKAKCPLVVFNHAEDFPLKDERQKWMLERLLKKDPEDCIIEFAICVDDDNGDEIGSAILDIRELSHGTEVKHAKISAYYEDDPKAIGELDVSVLAGRNFLTSDLVSSSAQSSKTPVPPSSTSPKPPPREGRSGNGRFNFKGLFGRKSQEKSQEK